MPIKIPNQLPATATLTRENIFVMTETRAITQDIRPLQILLLNLMPTKVDTETQLARVLGNTPLQIQLELIAPSGHVSKNTSQEHMLAFYRSFDEVRDRTFDGLIITGAPVENLPFEEVDYWPELCEIMEWSKTHVHSTLHICWGAQAGLYYHYGIPKRQLPQSSPVCSATRWRIPTLFSSGALTTSSGSPIPAIPPYCGRTSRPCRGSRSSPPLPRQGSTPSRPTRAARSS